MMDDATPTRGQIESAHDVFNDEVRKIRVGNRSLVGWTDENICAYLYLLHEDGEDKIMQLTVNSGPLMTVNQLRSEFKLWKEPDGAAPLTVRSVRGIPIKKILAESKLSETASDDIIDALGFIPSFAITRGNGEVLGFKSSAELASTLDQLIASFQYVGAINMGAANPVRVLADEQFNGDLRKARNQLSAARRNGLLTRGEKGSGRVQGELTPKALNLLEVMRELRNAKEVLG